MKRVLVVDVSVRVLFHTVLVGSLYLLFVGHNRPGGGFVGGLVAGAAIALRCDSSAKASCDSRSTFHCSATFSAVRPMP